MQLTDRKQQILKAIVDDYVTTAEPVGSQTLVRRHPLRVSAATVRHVMAELEEEGYLEQPHTSAGRTPSDRGYRFYVDSLMDLPDQPSDWQSGIRRAFRQADPRVNRLLQKASALLTETTGYPAFAVMPQIAETELLQMKMLMIEPGRVLVVLVLNPGLVRDRLIYIPEDLDEGTVQEVARRMEQHLAGKRVNEITWITVEAAAAGLPLPAGLLNQLLFEAYLAIKQAENLDTYLDGMANLLNHPEFRDARKARSLFSFLMRDGLLAGYLSETVPLPPPEPDWAMRPRPAEAPPAARDAFCIRIGQEIDLPGMEACSFVTAAYRVGETLFGQIGIVGPKRMPYSDVVSRVGFVRQALQQQIAQQERDGNDSESQV